MRYHRIKHNFRPEGHQNLRRTCRAKGFPSFGSDLRPWLLEELPSPRIPGSGGRTDFPIQACAALSRASSLGKTYCGWTKSCTTLTPSETLFVDIYHGIIIPGFLRCMIPAPVYTPVTPPTNENLMNLSSLLAQGLGLTCQLSSADGCPEKPRVQLGETSRGLHFVLDLRMSNLADGGPAVAPSYSKLAWLCKA